MRDVRIAEVAGRQFNRISRAQLLALGESQTSIARRVERGQLVIVEEGVFAFAPVLEHDPWGRWMGAALTHPESRLSRASAAEAWGFLIIARQVEMVTRPGNGGPRRHGRVLVFRSATLDGDCTQLREIPITSVERTLLDLAGGGLTGRKLARSVREAVRLKLVTVDALGDALGRYHGRRGSRRLARTVARYKGLPVEAARSGAEIRAVELLRDAGQPLPRLNVSIAGEEADLSWARRRLIIEIDGGPFHLDRGEDARKEAAWRNAGWTVRRLPSDDVYKRPNSLIALTHGPNVPQ